MSGFSNEPARPPVGRPAWHNVLLGKRPARTAVRLAVLVAGSALVFGVWLLPVRTLGVSMAPTYAPDVLKFVNAFAYAWRQPVRGDVVAIRLAGRRVLYLKRVVGLPGERIEMADGKMLIDGTELDEPYVAQRLPWTVPAVMLAADEYYVIGDNRGMPADQHLFGLVARDRIVGKVLF